MKAGQIRSGGLAQRQSGRGEPMVLVHGNLSDARSWDAIEPLLARCFRVLNYSRRFAYPNPPPPAGLEDRFATHVDDLIALIESQVHGKAHLVGNSSGAFICLLVAQQRPDLVRTLTLEEPPVVSMFLRRLPPGPGELLKLLLTSPGAFVEFVRFGATVVDPSTRAFQVGQDERATDIFMRGVLGDGAYRQLSAARRQQMMDNSQAHRATVLGAGLPVFTAEQAIAITTPTQLLHGLQTPRFQQRINRRLAVLIPGARDLAIPQASHLVHEDNPEAVAQAVTAFCKAH
jgi:pimeloyl-ACP methyl ester carboxylesterase